ncbi:MAG: tRNA1(Val) (adenine(37)-N6)-methyltransferase [Oscillospiraceae bacterium]|nr:tRNA1(Val) (adenine(37)-N6)-methyltransferase [Oscillospiraceae bacterium]
MDIDLLWKDGPRLIRDPDVFTLGTDAVLLSHFISEKRPGTLLDLGVGSGIIPLLAAWNDPELTAVGVEIQTHAAELAARNMELNGLSERVKIVTADMREWREPSLSGSFDLVVSNPPYFPAGSGRSALNPRIAIAREELMCTLADVCRAAAYYTRWGGSFCMVHRPERLAEVMHLMSSSGLEPKRLRFVHSRLDAAPSLILIDAKRGASPGLSILPPLKLYDENGGESEEVRKLYHR